MTPASDGGKRRLELFERVLSEPNHLRKAWLEKHGPDATERQALQFMLDRDAIGLSDFDPPSPGDLSALIETSHGSR